MVSGVAERLGFRSEATDKPKKKKHKKKVDKKRGRNQDADESTSSSGEEVWVEAEDVQAPGKSAKPKPASDSMKRDEWMTVAVGPSAMSIAAIEERQRKRSSNDFEQEKKKVRICSAARCGDWASCLGQ